MRPAFSMRNLAVMFRTNDPNIGHCSTFDEMTDAGLAYVFGLYRSIPSRHWKKRKAMAERIATELEREAGRLELVHFGQMIIAIGCWLNDFPPNCSFPHSPPPRPA